LYAGSGGVGFEAYSRGADVTWVENNPVVARLITRNATNLGIDGDIVALDVTRFLSRPGTPYDIIWMDPPYDLETTQVETIIDVVAHNGWATDGTLVVVERSRRSGKVEFPENFLSARERRYGDTTIVYAEMGNR
jgi:16S rRNA (guanine966-N2)-methyltransferase